jgi:N-acetylglucosaminyldiphosphoundecaprenol N-acetyl-beta-D-mannosaminyltransferase
MRFSSRVTRFSIFSLFLRQGNLRNMEKRNEAEGGYMADRVNICGVMIDNLTFVEALDAIDSFLGGGGFHSIVTPNVDHIVKLQEDAEFRCVYDNASLVLADGMPLLWASKYLGTPLCQKISGSDIFPLMCERAEQNHKSVFFLGGRPGAADAASEKMKSRFPNLVIAGTYCPPYGFEHDQEENERIIRMIRETAPDILFVGLGAPKQEKWVEKHRNDLGVPVSIGIGVTFEFVAGMVKRAPVWMQRIGLEWFWRVLNEPKRLFRRYFIDDFRFFGLVRRQKAAM